MGESLGTDSGDLGAKRAAYFHGYAAWHRDFLAQRTAEQYAGFLLPYLRPGMSVLDCGCGPGSITLGLAQAVQPGSVVGVDIGPPHLDAARTLAAERRVTNICFELADATRLPFPNASFDAAYANTLLLHMRDPLLALREIRRVLKPGGLVGVSDPDWTTVIWEPSTPLLDEIASLARRVFSERGSPYHARRQRALLLQAGFERSAGYALAESFGAPEATRSWAGVVQDQLREQSFIDLVTRRGWADHWTLEAMDSALGAWSEQPDAYYAILFGAGIGWVADDSQHRDSLAEIIGAPGTGE
jgi:ubiquinone/menaquinone biosynthesis C-methylase UbiE